MHKLTTGHNLSAAAVAVFALLCAANNAVAESPSVSVVIVRHGETDSSQPTLPLSSIGQQRAELLERTLRGVKFTHVFASHTTRARQMVEHIAAKNGVLVIQLPAPGSTFDGKPVTDETSRRAPIEPIATALLKLPPGSVALAALNSENIFAILNRLGVPLAAPGQSCAPGSMCVPCADNSCYPRAEFDHLWHVVREANRTEPIAFIELRYAVGWQPSSK